MGNQNGANSYAVDVVMCIDGTGSMEGIIEKVKKQAKSFYSDYLTAMAKGGKAVRDNHFRVKVIVFRDYMEDDAPAMEESRFFNMTVPEDQDAYVRFVNGINATGGGDDPENSLEAIFQAVKSDWTREGGRFRRHIILLFTDTSALPLHDPSRVKARDYPVDAPNSLDKLKAILVQGEGGQSARYGSYSCKNGRLIVYAPNGRGWDWVKKIPLSWLVPTKADGGCRDVDLTEAMNVLVSSIANPDPVPDAFNTEPTTTGSEVDLL